MSDQPQPRIITNYPNEPAPPPSNYHVMGISFLCVLLAVGTFATAVRGGFLITDWYKCIMGIIGAGACISLIGYLFFFCIKPRLKAINEQAAAARMEQELRQLPA